MKKQNKRWEILAPAGQPDSVKAAVANGADSIYLGLKHLNARSGAHNFTIEQLEECVKYCKLNAVKIYLTLNTIVFDSEYDQVLDAIQTACRLGIDGVIIQDLGVAALVRESAPGLRRHASTQMSIHTRKGAEFLLQEGFARAVLSREMSLDEIRDAAKSGIELESFVHGALCMCVSGQCLMSGMLGGRSANRGSCAQPCRLPFSAGKPGRCDLSLKDLSAVERIPELLDAGVYSLKIEGRMKRPEYVAAAVKACFDQVHGRQPDMKTLQSVFSRSGFTNGYLDSRLSAEMFGVRGKEDVTAASSKLLRKLENSYKQPVARIPVSLHFVARSGNPARLEAEDMDGNHVCVIGMEPEQAQTIPLNQKKAAQSLSKWGGTAFRLEKAEYQIQDGIRLPASELNRMRREAAEQMTSLRERIRPVPFSLPDRPDCNAPTQKLDMFRAEFRWFDQIPLDFADRLEYIGLDLNEVSAHLEELEPYQHKIMVIPPRVMFGIEEKVSKTLQRLRQEGYQHLLVQNLAHIPLGKELGYQLHGGFSLNIANRFSCDELVRLQLQDGILSPELRLEQVEKICSPLRRGVLVYGYLPLMITRNCPVRNVKSCRECGGTSELTDRKGMHFRVQCGHGCSEIHNAVPLWMGDRLNEIKNVSFGVLRFTFETRRECQTVLECLAARKGLEGKVTRGLYYRGVQAVSRQ